MSPCTAAITGASRSTARSGEVVAGKKAAREGDEITIFDSTGLAIQDLALARNVYERARERGLGTAMEIIPYPDSEDLTPQCWMC